MEPIYLAESVRQDHARLRGELAVLEQAKSCGSAHLWQVLRDVCARLSTGLREHMRLEEPLLDARNHSLGAADSDSMAHPPIDHYSDYRYLQVLTRHITLVNRPFLLNSRCQLLTDFLVGLHQHMDAQEEELFPDIKQAMTSMVREAV